MPRKSAPTAAPAAVTVPPPTPSVQTATPAPGAVGTAGAAPAMATMSPAPSAAAVGTRAGNANPTPPSKRARTQGGGDVEQVGLAINNIGNMFSSLVQTLNQQQQQMLIFNKDNASEMQRQLQQADAKRQAENDAQRQVDRYQSQLGTDASMDATVINAIPHVDQPSAQALFDSIKVDGELTQLQVAEVTAEARQVCALLTDDKKRDKMATIISSLTDIVHKGKSTNTKARAAARKLALRLAHRHSGGGGYAPMRAAAPPRAPRPQKPAGSCFLCGEAGHYASACPAKKPPAGQ